MDGLQSVGPFLGKSPEVACSENPRKAAHSPEEEAVGTVSAQSRLFLTSLGTVLVQPPRNHNPESRSTLLAPRPLYFSGIVRKRGQHTKGTARGADGAERRGREHGVLESARLHVTAQTHSLEPVATVQLQ